MGKKFEPAKFFAAARSQRLQKEPEQFQPLRLKEAREARGMSKGDLRIATRGRPVGSYENGTIVPNESDIVWLARALRMRTAFFTKPWEEYEQYEIEATGRLLGDREPVICGPEPCPCGVPDCPRFVTPNGDEIEPCPFGGKRAPCERCERPFTHLCDGPKRPDREGKDLRTCDARMCARHRHRVGPSADLCEKCFRRDRRSRKTAS